MACTRGIRTRGWRKAGVLLAAVWCAPLWAQPAATVYRCGQSYQQNPCDGGRMVEVDDSRDAEQQRAARDAAASERRLAEQLHAERRVREQARATQNAAAGIPLSPGFEPSADRLPDCVEPAGHAKSRSEKKRQASKRTGKPDCQQVPAYLGAKPPR